MGFQTWLPPVALFLVIPHAAALAAFSGATLGAVPSMRVLSTALASYPCRLMPKS